MIIYAYPTKITSFTLNSLTIKFAFGHEGGDFHIINGTYTKLADVGRNYGGNSVAEQEKQEAGDVPREEAEQEQPPEEATEREAPGHAKRRSERKAARQGKQPRKAEK